MSEDERFASASIQLRLRQRKTFRAALIFNEAGKRQWLDRAAVAAAQQWSLILSNPRLITYHCSTRR
jgi:hypothetical protein